MAEDVTEARRCGQQAVRCAMKRDNGSVAMRRAPGDKYAVTLFRTELKNVAGSGKTPPSEKWQTGTYLTRHRSCPAASTFVRSAKSPYMPNALPLTSCWRRPTFARYQIRHTSKASKPYRYAPVNKTYRESMSVLRISRLSQL